MKILYVTSKGGIHDYRFLAKLVKDYRVLLLHYAADELIHEINRLPGLEIIRQIEVLGALLCMALQMMRG